MIEAPTGTTDELSVNDFFALWLQAAGIEHVFSLPGGMIAPLLDAIHRSGAAELVTMHHEQGVAFAVDGYGRFKGTPAIGLSTAGPGATNMLTGIASSFLDSVPGIFVTGQVQSYLLKGDRPVRQFGFQECDIGAIARPVVKGAWQVRAGSEIPRVFNEAAALATTGRPGSVLIELPSDVQTMGIPDAVVEPPPVAAPPAVDPAEVDSVLDMLASAERPLVLLGGGVQAARAAEACEAFIDAVGAPAAASVMALDVLPAGHPSRLGMIGMYGNRWVNLSVAESDLVLALGSRLDFGTIGADVGAFARNRTIVQVDCDEGEMNRVRNVKRIVADLGTFLPVAADRAREREWQPRAEWHAQLEELRARWPDTEELEPCEGINPNRLVRELSESSPLAAAFVIDAGQHLWWACQSIQPRRGQRFMPALGLGPCGYALPAAVGVAVAAQRPVVVVAGDGAFQLNIQELQTVVRNRLPMKIVIVDNGCHGSVRQLQEQAFDERYPTTVLGYDAPDFARVAAAYGIDSLAVDSRDELERGLEWLWSDPLAPALLHVHISPELNVYPNVPFGAPLTTMESMVR